MNAVQSETENLYRLIETDTEQVLSDIDLRKMKLGGQRSVFIEYINELIKDRDFSPKTLFECTGISQSQTYQILNGSRGAGRDNILCFALAMGLSLDETQRLLMLSQNGILYPKVRRDAVLICFIQKNYGQDIPPKTRVYDANELLIKMDEKGIMKPE